MLSICRAFPAYTPETARQAPVWVLRDLNLLTAAGYFEAPSGD